MQASSSALSPPDRLTELDSLRGLAALMVVMHHLVKLWIEDARTGPVPHLVRAILLPVVLGGDGAVLLFFVLSGFVLSLPAVAGRPQPYAVFLVRRVFRIYIPYLAALALSVAGAYWLHGAVTGCDWFHRVWSEPVNLSLVGRHLAFLGEFNTEQFDPPIWSLVYEMRISLFFPLLCAFVLRYKTRWPVVMICLLSALSIAADTYGGAEFGRSLVDTLYFAGFFILGIFLARDRAAIAVWWKGLTRPAKIALGIVCVGGYLLVGPWILKWKILHSLPLTVLISQWLKALSAGGLIVLSLNADVCRRFLGWAPVRWAGIRSYSLYLMHYVVLLYCVHLLDGRMPFKAILGLVFVLSLAVSWATYRFVEVPSMNLGRRLSYIAGKRVPAVKV
jgi:peptidoglycan/LPS O-acetylase OafA/YrhL